MQALYTLFHHRAGTSVRASLVHVGHRCAVSFIAVTARIPTSDSLVIAVGSRVYHLFVVYAYNDRRYALPRLEDQRSSFPFSRRDRKLVHLLVSIHTHWCDGVAPQTDEAIPLLSLNQMPCSSELQLFVPPPAGSGPSCNPTTQMTTQNGGAGRDEWGSG